MSTPLHVKIDRLLNCDASELSDTSRKMLTEIRDKSLADTAQQAIQTAARLAVGKVWHRTIDRRFVELIRAGTKRTTIRSHPVKFLAGDTLVLKAWIGQPYRSKQETVGTYRIDRVADVYVHVGGIGWNTPGGVIEFAADELAKTLKDDGFKDWPAMREYFNRNGALPFFGQLVHFCTVS